MCGAFFQIYYTYNAMKTHVKKGDKVTVITGNNKGKSGTILTVNALKGTVILDGVRTVAKATRKSEKNPEGGHVATNAPIHISNVKKA